MIKLQQITKRYNEKKPFGVSEINFELQKGEKLTIIGPSGSGKSTLLNIISNKITPDSGDLKIDENLIIASLGSAEIIPENITINDYLLKQIESNISDEQKVNAVRTTLSLFELTTEIHKYPGELSSGQYQRVLLSKCIVQNPDLILLDEPFAHLDQKLSLELREEFFKILKDQEITVLWATHDLNNALVFSDRIMVINLGQIEQIDTPKNIYQHPQNIFVADLFPFSSIVFKNENYQCFRPESIKIHSLGNHKALASNFQYIGNGYIAQVHFEDNIYYAYTEDKTEQILFDFLQDKIYSVKDL